MMAFQVQQLNVGGYDHNFSYLVVADNGDAALVDPTGDCEKSAGRSKRRGRSRRAISC